MKSLRHGRKWITKHRRGQAGLYGCSKVFGEALARHFTDTCEFFISIICLRIGAVTRENRPSRYAWLLRLVQPTAHVAQMIEKCIEAPESVKFDIFEVVSDQQVGLPRHFTCS